MRRLLAAATLAATVAFAATMSLPAFADADPTMDQIYSAAAGGHLDQAQQMINQVLADHPTSAKAHYVQAELYAREGKTGLARSELSTAEQLKPGLPFANPRSVQELKAQLGLRTGAMSPTVIRSVPAEPRFPWGTVLILAGVVAVLFLVFRRRNTYVQYPSAGPEPMVPAAATVPLRWAAAESAPVSQADSPQDWRWAQAWLPAKSWLITSWTAAAVAAVSYPPPRPANRGSATATWAAPTSA
jgi:hypothetical protein